MEGGLTGLHHCWHTNYHRAFCLYRVLFSTKQQCSVEQLLAADPSDPSYCWLYLSKQAVDHPVHFVCLYRVLFSHLKCQVLAESFSARTVWFCWHWQIIDPDEYE